ncbi:MAG: DUF4422 domain-containing protein [Roseburia sp.]|nr:DUF4422 domain-containing protein [Anaeroplasma bactoclasticum]MCM1196718.1 DUF4422 domain-containing protein [Roseburia sp.]MCM1557676.1 DUF4422 domain-containing protein [Anaeroplasma bactoclasticum]
MLDMYVITHKKIEDKRIPKNRKMLLVGSYNKEERFGYLCDDEDDNISDKNPYFCELTGLYAMWKHSTSSHISLEHYRRLFSNGKINFLHYKIISKEKMENLMMKYDLVLPHKQCWPKYKSLMEQYANEHIEEDILALEKIVLSKYPAFEFAWNQVMYLQNYCYPYNMFVGKKEMIDEYCSFLFDVLFELEKQINVNDGRDAYQKRVFGFLSERLFNVWLCFKGNLKIKELNVATLGDKPIKDFVRRAYRKVYWRSHGFKG